MEQKFPKNIRQIGNVSDNTKVYVEDYVDTYFNQLCDKESQEPKGAFLIGEMQKDGQEHYVMVNGAVQMQDLLYDGTDIVLGENTWRKGCEDSKKHFEGKAILGWCLIENDRPLKTTTKLLKVHQKMFHKKNRIFVMVDAVEKEQKYFKFKFNDLMELGGHFVYYEKNPLMQDYMIAKRKQNCVTPSENYEDRAAKDFRSIIKDKEVAVVKKKKIRSSYFVSTAVLVMALGMGIASVNDYDKMLEVGQLVTEKINTFLGKEGENAIYANTMDVEVKEELLEEGIKEDEVIEEEPQEQNVTLVEIGTLESEDKIVKEQEPEILDPEETVIVQESIEPQGDEDVSTYTVYVVKQGDSLASISRATYGTIAKVEDICELNNIKSSDYIYMGQEIKLP